MSANFYSTIVCLALVAQEVSASQLTFSSGEEKVQLIELYTSQGCSSCPPAEAKLNALRDSEGLWQRFVPIAFHVDYWDGLGWEDPFASRSNTERQYRIARSGIASSVYTPCFVVDGKEWQGFFRGKAWPKWSDEKAGQLEARIESSKLTATYSKSSDALVVHVAIVGCELETDVRKGENRGRTLEQEFVLLWMESGDLAEAIALPNAGSLPAAGRYGIAVWLTRQGGLKPIQAAGAWIDLE